MRAVRRPHLQPFQPASYSPLRHHHDFRITRYQQLELNRITLRLVCTSWNEIALSTLRIYVHRRRKLGGTPPATYKLHYIDYSAQSTDLVTLITLSNSLRSLSLHSRSHPAQLWFSLAEIAQLFPQLVSLSIVDSPEYEGATTKWSMPHLEVFEYTLHSPFPYNPPSSKWNLPALEHLAIVFFGLRAEPGVGAMSFIQAVGPLLETLALGSAGFKFHIPETCWPRLTSLRMLVVDADVEGLQHIFARPTQIGSRILRCAYPRPPP